MDNELPGWFNEAIDSAAQDMRDAVAVAGDEVTDGMRAALALITVGLPMALELQEGPITQVPPEQAAMALGGVGPGPLISALVTINVKNILLISRMLEIDTMEMWQTMATSLNMAMAMVDDDQGGQE